MQKQNKNPSCQEAAAPFPSFFPLSPWGTLFKHSHTPDLLCFGLIDWLFHLSPTFQPHLCPSVTIIRDSDAIPCICTLPWSSGLVDLDRALQSALCPWEPCSCGLFLWKPDFSNVGKQQGGCFKRLTDKQGLANCHLGSLLFLLLSFLLS